MRRTLPAVALGGALVSALLMLSTPAGAQVPRRPDSEWARDPAAVPGPQVTRASSPTDPALARLAARPQPRAPTYPLAARKETGLTLMIVGGAMFVSGLIIGDAGGALIAVAGVGIGAYGVYLYVP